MSKDPAFLFYHQDFFSGVSDMTNEEIGAYVKCMCVQASKTGITEKHMLIICNSQETYNVVRSKFVINEEINLLENLRLKNEIDKRKKYSESRSNNRKKTDKPKEPDTNTSKTYEKHMEDENENEVENKNTKEIDIVIDKKPKIDFQEIINIFNTVCFELPKVQSLSEKRKGAIREILKTNSLEQIGDVFRNVSESDFLNGKITHFVASFDWIMKPDNFIKILENNYKNNNNGNKANNIQQTIDERYEDINNTVDKYFVKKE